MKGSKKKDFLWLFFEVSSLRGVQRIRNANSRFQRSIWIMFVVLMTCLLIIITIILVNSYLRYDTAWHDKKDEENSGPFPAATICAQNPFALKAADLWNNGTVLSPLGLRHRRNKFFLDLWNNFSSNLSKPWNQVPLLDSTNFYFANLNLSEATSIGHQQDILVACILVNQDDS
ncbi:hypothetical protein Ciccas_013856, partial [Cichlidogyrus casuarinus]